LRGKRKPSLILTVVFVMLGAMTAWAQQQDNPQSGVSPTGNPENRSAASNPDQAGDQPFPAAIPVTPITGARDFGPGASYGGRSYVLPVFQWTGLADTGINGAAGYSNLQTRSVYLGSLTAERLKSHSQTALGLAGGAYLFSDSLRANKAAPIPSYGTLLKASLSETVIGRRWELLLSEQGLYMPESSFGFSGGGGLSGLGGGLEPGALGNQSSLNPTLLPNQTLLTGTSRRISNTAVAEVTYHPGARSSFTATGLYGLLNYLDPGFIDDNYWTFLGGYNFQLSRRNQIGINYTHTLFKFSSNNFELLNRGFQLFYGHRLTGRLSLEVAAGPTLNQIAQPQGAGVVTRGFWTTFDSLKYQGGRNEVSVDFARYLSGGAGVLLGAESDLARVSINRQLTRKWRGALNLAHAYNQSLIRQSLVQRRSQFETWVAGFTFSREFGDHVTFHVEYNAQRQIANALLCTTTNCGTIRLRQVGGIGLSWHGRPLGLR
jgi:hypothetical protein